MALAPAPPPPPRLCRHLPPAELDERRRQGLCYNCDKQYGLYHKCQCLFYIEVTDPADDRTQGTEEIVPAANTPVISLHAMAGICTAGTMQLHVSIANQRIVALLDSGSTHNFVRRDAARQVGLAFHPSAGAHVTVANGIRVACQGLARDVDIRIGAETFAIDCYSVPLDSYDMVLGAAFLCTLGPILWDSDDFCMAFWCDGRRVLWRGLGSPRSDVSVPGCQHAVRDAEPAIHDHLNMVAAARSHHAGDGSHLSAPSGPSFTIFEDLRHDGPDYATRQTLSGTFIHDSGEPWHVVDGLLRGVSLFVPVSTVALATVLQFAHTTGHDGVRLALQRLHRISSLTTTNSSSGRSFAPVLQASATRRRPSIPADSFSWLASRLSWRLSSRSVARPRRLPTSSLSAAPTPLSPLVTSRPSSWTTTPPAPP